MKPRLLLIMVGAAALMACESSREASEEATAEADLSQKPACAQQAPRFRSGNPTPDMFELADVPPVVASAFDAWRRQARGTEPDVARHFGDVKVEKVIRMDERRIIFQAVYANFSLAGGHKGSPSLRSWVVFHDRATNRGVSMDGRYEMPVGKSHIINRTDAGINAIDPTFFTYDLVSDTGERINSASIDNPAPNFRRVAEDVVLAVGPSYVRGVGMGMYAMVFRPDTILDAISTGAGGAIAYPEEQLPCSGYRAGWRYR